ncbi:MAG: antitoxin MazE [Blastocatellia bacterium]
MYQVGCSSPLDSHPACNYIVAMKTRIIRIGNSQGIRIPKLYLQQTGLGEEVNLEVQDNEIIIRPAQHPRQGWAEAFQTMAKYEDDQLLDKEAVNQSEWDEAEWQW